MNTIQITPFSKIYDIFLSKITDDMYMELTELETFRMLEELLIAAIPKFEFPRVNIFDYEENYIEDENIYCGVESDYTEVRAIVYDGGYFNSAFNLEENNILATYMIVEWLSQQLASVENTRMKYSGSDFKFTSQANHMQKLLALKKDYEREGFHLQRLYKRRIPDNNGIMRSTFAKIMTPPDYEFDFKVKHKSNKPKEEDKNDKECCCSDSDILWGTFSNNEDLKTPGNDFKEDL